MVCTHPNIVLTEIPFARNYFQLWLRRNRYTPLDISCSNVRIRCRCGPLLEQQCTSCRLDSASDHSLDCWCIANRRWPPNSRHNSCSMGQLRNMWGRPIPMDKCKSYNSPLHSMDLDSLHVYSLDLCRHSFLKDWDHEWIYRFYVGGIIFIFKAKLWHASMSETDQNSTRCLFAWRRWMTIRFAGR